MLRASAVASMVLFFHPEHQGMKPKASMVYIYDVLCYSCGGWAEIRV